MPLKVPPELKPVTPYVRRAEELDRDKANPESRLVAYYCRQYAVHVGIPLASSGDGKNCLGELLGNLEEEKTAMDSFTRDEAKFLCQKFAHKIFDKADLDDREGNATKATAKTFYAAASFLEMLQQFYSDDDDTEDITEIRKRAKYAKWKATEMLKAFREGRQPTPGEYAADSDQVLEGGEGNETSTAPSAPPPAMEPPKVETVEDTDDSGNKEEEPEPSISLRPPSPEPEPEKEEEGTEVELGPPPAFDAVVPPPVVPPVAPPAAPSAPVHRPPLTFSPPPVAPPMPAPPTSKPQPPPPEPEPKKSSSSSFFGFGKKKGKASKAQIADATELTRFALAALEDKNADLAAERLKLALQALGR